MQCKVINKSMLRPIRITGSMLFIAIASFAACCSVVSGLPGGAPTFGNVCDDLMQQHADTPATPCGDLCPFSLTLDSIDGGKVPTGRETLYRCGSVHTLCIRASGEALFRGFAVQAREASEIFSVASGQSGVGSFTNVPTEVSPLPWQMWDCSIPGVTHTESSDKTEVCFDWQAPSPSNTLPVTFWFSIARNFANFHSQLRGLDLTPDPAFCASTNGEEFPANQRNEL